MILSNHLIIKYFYAFSMYLQIRPSNRSDNEDSKAPLPLLNADCRDTEFPANGDCDDGWYVYINSTHIPPDETASIDCLECKI